jgi:hypothetical protein
LKLRPPGTIVSSDLRISKVIGCTPRSGTLVTFSPGVPVVRGSSTAK